MDCTKSSARPTRVHCRWLRLDDGSASSDPLGPSILTPLHADTLNLASPRKAGSGRYLKAHCIPRRDLAAEEADAELVSIWLGMSNRKGLWSCEAYSPRPRSNHDGSPDGSAGDRLSSTQTAVAHNRRLAELNADVTPLSRQGTSASGAATSGAPASLSSSGGRSPSLHSACTTTSRSHRPVQALRRSAQGSSGSPSRSSIDDTAQSRLAPCRLADAPPRATESPPADRPDANLQRDRSASTPLDSSAEVSDQPAGRKAATEEALAAVPSTAGEQQDTAHRSLVSSHPPDQEAAETLAATLVPGESKQETSVQDDGAVLFHHETPRVDQWEPPAASQQPATAANIESTAATQVTDSRPTVHKAEILDSFQIPLDTQKGASSLKAESRPPLALAAAPAKKKTAKRKKAIEKVKHKLAKMELFSLLLRKTKPKAKAKAQAKSTSTLQPKPGSRGGNPRANPKIGPWTPAATAQSTQQQHSRSGLDSRDLIHISSPFDPQPTATYQSSPGKQDTERNSLEFPSPSQGEAELQEESDLVRAEESMDVGQTPLADLLGHSFIDPCAIDQEEDQEEHLGDGISFSGPMPELEVCETPRLPAKPAVPAPSRLVPAAQGTRYAHCCPETAKERLYEAAGFDPTHVFEEKGWFDPFSKYNNPVTSSLPVCWETFLANRGQVESPGSSEASSNASKETVEIRCSQVVSRSRDSFSVASARIVPDRHQGTGPY